MAMTIIDYKVKSASINLSPDIAPNRNYKINPKIGCSIKRGENKLLVNFTVEVARGADPVPFEFRLVADGIIGFEDSDDFSTVTTKAAEAIYPFVRSSVASLTQIANVPPYILPFVNLADL